MKKNKKPKGYDHHPVDPPPTRFGRGQRFNVYLEGRKGREGREGQELPLAGGRGGGRGRRKKRRRNKLRKVTKPLHKKTILQLLQNCIGPSFCICQEIQCLPYAGFKKIKL